MPCESRFEGGTACVMNRENELNTIICRGIVCFKAIEIMRVGRRLRPVRESLSFNDAVELVILV
jgi:hypothetical protein